MSTTEQSGDPEPAELVTPTEVDVGALYKRYHGRLRRHAVRHLPLYLRHEADNALMAVFTRLAASKAKKQLAEQANWEAYLLLAVKNACQDIIKTTKINDELDHDQPGLHRDAESDPVGDMVVDRMDNERNAAIAKRALDSLDARSRRIFAAKVLDLRSNSDIGRELGISGQRVSQIHNETLRLLREEVTRTDG